MGVIDRLSQMQADALEQLRAGEHSEFLVGFLTTSVMLELSNLVAAELDLNAYGRAVVDVLTQHAPVERCAIGVEAADLPRASASVGFEPDEIGDLVAGLPVGPHAAPIEVPDLVRGGLLAGRIPAALLDSGFVGAAATQISAGIGRVVEHEQLRRRAAAARALRVVAGLDERWGAEQLCEIADAFGSLPGVVGARVQATSARFAGTIDGSAGLAPEPDRAPLQDDRVEHREATFETDLSVEIRVVYELVATDEQRARLDEVFDAWLVSLERIEQTIQLANEADTDQLTGVGNRRRASKALAQARAMADARGESMTVLLCDLDHFKHVNDHFGHTVGDAVLVRFAALLRASVRSHDTVIRWGGEEFLVVCPSCDESGAVSLAERLLVGCPDACADVLPDDVKQTASIGIAAYPGSAHTPESLIGAADEALYLAKRSGRNQHRSAQPR
jgi:diguanylate cyclase (GGDEF)-like protein